MGDEDIEVEVDKTMELLFKASETLAILEESITLMEECYFHEAEVFESLLAEECPWLDMNTVNFEAFLIPPEGYLTIAKFNYL